MGSISPAALLAKPLTNKLDHVVRWQGSIVDQPPYSRKPATQRAVSRCDRENMLAQDRTIRTITLRARIIGNLAKVKELELPSE